MASGILLHHGGDPLYKLTGLMGGLPQVLLHGDDLGAESSAITTWPNRTGTDASANGGPTVGLTWAAATPGVFYKAGENTGVEGAGQYYNMPNAEASNYTVGTSFMWLLAARFPTSAAGRNVIFLGSSSSAGNYRGFTINTTNDFAYLSSNRNGSTQFTAGTAVTENVQCVMGILLTGSTVTIKQLTSSGESTLLSAAHTMTGTLTIDRFTLAVLISNGVSTGGTTMLTRFFAARRDPTRTLTATDLTNAMTLVRDRFRCPLP